MTSVWHSVTLSEGRSIRWLVPLAAGLWSGESSLRRYELVGLRIRNGNVVGTLRLMSLTRVTFRLTSYGSFVNLEVQTSCMNILHVDIITVKHFAQKCTRVETRSWEVREGKLCSRMSTSRKDWSARETDSCKCLILSMQSQHDKIDDPCPWMIDVGFKSWKRHRFQDIKSHDWQTGQSPRSGNHEMQSLLNQDYNKSSHVHVVIEILNSVICIEDARQSLWIIVMTLFRARDRITDMTSIFSEHISTINLRAMIFSKWDRIDKVGLTVNISNWRT